MGIFAVVSPNGGTVSNIIVGNTLEEVIEVVGDAVEITETTGVAGFGFYYDAALNQFISPSPVG